MIQIIILRAPDLLTLDAKKTIEDAKTIFLQTEKHPSASAVCALNETYTAMDDLFESCEDFDTLNREIALRLVRAGECVYVATGNIIKSQLPVIRGEAEKAGVSVDVFPYVSAANAAFAGRDRAAEVSAHDLPERFDPDGCYVIDEIDDRLTAGETKLALSEFYPDEWPAAFARIGKDGRYYSREIPLCELDRQPDYDAACVIYIGNVPFLERTRHGLDDVMRVVRRLRAPDGCPWDREQTHASLKKALLEECYELLDAIDEDDDAHICEELGDVLLQFALHAAIAEEQSAFTDRDAATELVEKLIYRHPHVFGKVRVSGTADVLKNWDALKMAQRKQTTQAEVLKSVPKSFPALLRSRKVQKKAADVGFDWPNAGEAFFKISEETQELKEAMETGGNVSEEAGDLLFAVVNVARLLNLEPEFLLAAATDKFIARFEEMERLAGGGKDALEGMSLEEMDKLWERAKKSRSGEEIHK